MGDRWGDGGPPAEAYSRVTRDLDAVFAGLHDVAQDAVERLCRDHDVLRVPMASWWVGPGPDRPVPAPDLVGAWWLLPADPRCLPAAVALLGRWDVQVRHTWFGDAAPSAVGCTCDACDTDLAEASEDLRRMLDLAAGSHHESVRPHGLLGRSRWFSSGSVAVGEESGSGALVEPGDPLHARLPRRARLSWPAWPRPRPVTT